MFCIGRFTPTFLYSLVCTSLFVLSAAEWPKLQQRDQPAQRQADAFHQQTLDAHNRLRQKHGSPPLRLSADLNDYSQRYAEQLARTNTFQHSACKLNGQPIGENLAAKWGSGAVDYTGNEVTQSWYDEIKNYNFGSPGFSMNTGHFTQVVWKNTQELGVGKAKDSSGKVYVVCNYRPAGNYLGEFPQNVLPPK